MRGLVAQLPKRCAPPQLPKRRGDKRPCHKKRRVSIPGVSHPPSNTSQARSWGAGKCKWSVYAASKAMRSPQLPKRRGNQSQVQSTDTLHTTHKQVTSTRQGSHNASHSQARGRGIVWVYWRVRSVTAPHFPPFFLRACNNFVEEN